MVDGRTYEEQLYINKPLTQPFDVPGIPTANLRFQTVNVTGCLFQGDGTPDNIGVGVWGQAGDDLDVVMVECEIYDWDWGIDVWDDGTRAECVAELL